jgi:integrase
MLLVAYHTGMRRGEIVRLRWEQLDLKRGILRLRSRDTKTDESHLIPPNHPLRALFNRLPGGGGEPRLCESPDGPILYAHLVIHGVSTGASAGGNPACDLA